jgi:hypothetical protein
LINDKEAIDYEAKVPPRTKRITTKSFVGLPDLEHANIAVLNSLTDRDAQTRLPGKPLHELCRQELPIGARPLILK